tara:strand:- start:1902 stop:2291 length:390 start_codon:yes stop_codon:yes gene_type:complete
MSDTMYDIDYTIKTILDGSINNPDNPVHTKSKRRPTSLELVCGGIVTPCYLITGPAIQEESPEIDATIIRLKIDPVTDKREVELYTKTIWPIGKTILPVARHMYLEAWGSELKPRTIMRISGEDGSIAF